MSIERQLYDSASLLGVMREIDVPMNYWLDLCFPGTYASEDEFIDFSKIDKSKRKLAPLVVPTAQGKPIYSAAERTFRVKPAYLKPRDPVSAARMINRQAGLGELLSATPLSPAQRYQAVVADIALEHRNAIFRMWEWMAAQAIINGEVTLEDDGYPTALVQFGRAAGHSITLGAGSRWGDAGVSILNMIEDWRKLVREANFGGPTNRLTVGTDAWEAMRQNAEIRELLKVDYRPSNNGLQLNLGIREGLDAEFVGRLSGTLDVYVYSDYYHNKAGDQVPFLNSKDVVLTGPNVMGLKAYGAILDTKANFQPLPIFPKMWENDDPSATFIMTQSAPLMIPVNPNNTLRARVLA